MPTTEQEREKFQPLFRASQDGQILKEMIMADSVSNIRIADRADRVPHLTKNTTKNSEY